MRKLLWICLLLIICMLQMGCQREIDLNLPEYQTKLVVEGTIESGFPAMVMLSRSIPYFSEVNLSTLMSDVIVNGTQARVFITSETGESEELTWTLTPESPLYMAFLGKNVIGKEQTHYTLTVEYNGQTYTAETYIPKSFDLDSIGFNHDMEILADTMASIRVLFTDPADEVNYYAFFCKVKCPKTQDRLWVCNLPVAFNDLAFNGQTLNYEVARYGYSTLMLGMMSEEEQRAFARMTFRPGDTVVVKHSQMDYHTFKFLSSAGSEAAFGSSPFTNPLPSESNFNSEDVIGHWSGYASKFDTLVWECDNYWELFGERRR